MNKCQKITNDPIIKFKERKSSVIFCNPRKVEVLRVEVDGCLLINEEACDHLLCHAGKNYYVELKGCNNVKALQQIASTFEKVNNDFGGAECVPVISSTKVPSITDVQKAVLKFKKRVPNSMDPIISSSGIKISLDS